MIFSFNSVIGNTGILFGTATETFSAQCDLHELAVPHTGLQVWCGYFFSKQRSRLTDGIVLLSN